MTTNAARPGGARGMETGRSGPPASASAVAQDKYKYRIPREEGHG
jgi:hypothetical protein